jgi:hypothetical protein
MFQNRFHRVLVALIAVLILSLGAAATPVAADGTCDNGQDPDGGEAAPGGLMDASGEAIEPIVQILVTILI